jgi:hypothetical protein
MSQFWLASPELHATRNTSFAIDEAMGARAQVLTATA